MGILFDSAVFTRRSGNLVAELCRDSEQLPLRASIVPVAGVRRASRLLGGLRVSSTYHRGARVLEGASRSETQHQICPDARLFPVAEAVPTVARVAEGKPFHDVSRL